MRYSAVPRHVYLHVPFCARRCSYCDFSIAVRRTVPVDEYCRALESELAIRFRDHEPTEVDTIYLGGGTPSLLGGSGVARALSLVRDRFPLAPDAEVTIEANPDDVNESAVAAWVDAGVNRLSIGSQSFDDAALAWMHRTHDGAAIERAVAVARSGGIRNLSLDLIFALPERVERAEEGYEAEYLAAHEALTAAGLEHYEVSNYARPGMRSRHNSSYWTGVPYVGLGPAAHEFDGHARRWNARAYAEWRDLLARGSDPLGGREELTEQNRLAESVYLGLRSDAGLQLGQGERDLVAPWEVAQWVTRDADDRMRCTALGWLRLDALAAALTHSRSR